MRRCMMQVWTVFWVLVAGGCSGGRQAGDPSGWTASITLAQVEEMRSIEDLLPVLPDSVIARYRRYNPPTFYREFRPELLQMGRLIDSLNRGLEAPFRVDTLSIDHTFENIGTAAVRGRTLFLSSSYFYIFNGSAALRSVVMHEFGHRYARRLSPEEHSSLKNIWNTMQRTALFYIFRDGEYSGNARFGGHPEESPEELFASAFNIFHNSPEELNARLMFVAPDLRALADELRALVRSSSRRGGGAM